MKLTMLLLLLLLLLLLVVVVVVVVKHIFISKSMEEYFYPSRFISTLLQSFLIYK